jgi:hypothetical protein
VWRVGVTAGDRAFRPDGARYIAHRDAPGRWPEAGLHLRRLALMPVTSLRRGVATWRIRRGGFPDHVAVLQLAHDAALPAHSPVASMTEFLGRIIRGFAEGAPPHHHHLVEAHLLEDGRAPIPAPIPISAATCWKRARCPAATPRRGGRRQVLGHMVDMMLTATDPHDALAQHSAARHRGNTCASGPDPGRGRAGPPRPVWFAYPRYRDPVSGPPIPAKSWPTASPPCGGAVNRLLAKAQGALAGHAVNWREWSARGKRCPREGRRQVRTHVFRVEMSDDGTQPGIEWSYPLQQQSYCKCRIS